MLMARPRQLAREFNLPTIESQRLMFSQSPILWLAWCRVWKEEQEGQPLSPLQHELWTLLPRFQTMTKTGS